MYHLLLIENFSPNEENTFFFLHLILYGNSALIHQNSHLNNFYKRTAESWFDFAPLLCCITECPLEGECLMMPASDQASKSPGLWRNKRRKASRRKQLGGSHDVELYWQPLQVGLGPFCVCVCVSEHSVIMHFPVCVATICGTTDMCVNKCKAVIT